MAPAALAGGAAVGAATVAIAAWATNSPESTDDNMLPQGNVGGPDDVQRPDATIDGGDSGDVRRRRRRRGGRGGRGDEGGNEEGRNEATGPEGVNGDTRPAANSDVVHASEHASEHASVVEPLAATESPEARWADEPVTPYRDVAPAIAETAVHAAPVEPLRPVTPLVAAPVAPFVTAPAARAAIDDAVPSMLTKAAPFVLATESLHGVAESAGLQWVTSNADKVRAVQEAMALEPKAAPAARAPKASVQADDGPLVLVETKKDLAQVQFPFDAR